MTMLSSLGRQSLTTAFGWAAKSKLWNKLWYFLMTVFDDRHSLGSYFRSLRWHCKYFFLNVIFLIFFGNCRMPLLDCWMPTWFLGDIPQQKVISKLRPKGIRFLYIDQTLFPHRCFPFDAVDVLQLAPCFICWRVVSYFPCLLWWLGVFP